jgi:hypothetical protein
MKHGEEWNYRGRKAKEKGNIKEDGRVEKEERRLFADFFFPNEISRYL